MSDWSKEDIRKAIVESDARSAGGRPKKRKQSKRNQDLIPITVSIPYELVRDLETWCRLNEYGRPQIIRELIKSHLDSDKMLKAIRGANDESDNSQ